LSLKKLDFLSRDQLRELHQLGQIRNANRILGELSPYLSKYRDEYATVYFLNAKGRDYVGSEKVRKRGMYSQHSVVRNDFYIFSGCPTDWKNEIMITKGLICDSWYKSEGYYNFLEVDLTQPMKANKAKIEKYRELYASKALEKKFGYAPVLNWLTTTELRRKQLQDLCKDLPCQVFTTQDIK
jgi:hypothetical protein